MKPKTITTLLSILSMVLFFESSSLAQRGLGQPAGVVRQQLITHKDKLQGKVLEVITAPCEKTTGWALQGAHFTIETEKGKFNVHLGPASLVENVTSVLKPGMEVTANVFRTDNMDKTHYIAIDVTANNKTMEIRDKNLRPLWAAGPARFYNTPRQSPAAAAPPITPRLGRGMGRGLGMGAGYGRGMGRGMGLGRGMGYGRGMYRGFNCPAQPACCPVCGTNYCPWAF